MLKKMNLLLLATTLSTAHAQPECMFQSCSMIELQGNDGGVCLSVTGNPSTEDILAVIKVAASHINPQDAAVQYVKLNRNVLNNLKTHFEYNFQNALAKNVQIDQAYTCELFGKLMNDMADATLEMCLDAGALQYALPLEIKKTINKNLATCCQNFMITLNSKITENLAHLNLESIEDKKIYFEFITQLLSNYFLDITTTLERTLAQFYPDAFQVEETSEVQVSEEVATEEQESSEDSSHEVQGS